LPSFEGLSSIKRFSGILPHFATFSKSWTVHSSCTFYNILLLPLEHLVATRPEMTTRSRTSP
jgi:hypothetical protein